MKKMIETAVKQETAVLVGIVYPQTHEEEAKEYLAELEFLAITAGVKTVKSFTQKLTYPNPRTFLGEGKIAEVLSYVEEHEIDVVIFDDELSPSQMRNIEKIFKVKIYDRSLLILDIFQLRAKSAQAKTQVELARSEYLLPRLTRLWTHLERQRGGTGTRGGAGEKEIETDRRMIRNKISKLKQDLAQIDKVSSNQRKNRKGVTRIALVGYTNVGKSTIMNVLSKSEVLAEDKLFATLDSTVRKVVLEHVPFLLSDTVGFIRKLPHQLVECFKSTLDEVREADIVIHVVDISHPVFEQHMSTVKSTLQEIGADDKPTLLVFNKIDRMKHQLEGKEALEQLKQTWMAKAHTPSIFISAAKKENLQELRSAILGMMEKHVPSYYKQYHYQDEY